MADSFRLQIYALVARIPPGQIMTYGQIAECLGTPRAARQVGYAMARCPSEAKLPWHRVINAKGEISRRANPGDEEYQRLLLEAEGVRFDQHGRIDLAVYRWDP